MKKRSSPRHIEDLEQQALFSWANLYRLPPADDVEGYLIDYLFAIPNGGKRNPKEAARLKGQGVKAGVSDTLLPIARGGYHGLWIELKPPKEFRSRVEPSQADWMHKMRKAGYLAFVEYGWLAAKHRIIDYLEGDRL